jgi:dTDP-4-dehydrorhamnose 3,5-epimerase
MHVEQTSLPGVLLIAPQVHRDPRGFFIETYHQQRYRDAGVDAVFVQDNHSASVQGTLRGLHAQLKRPQAKLVRCVEGEIWDVAVDIRVGSPTFGQWTGAELSAATGRQIYIPIGFAHGFVVLSERAQVEYKCSDVYVPDDQLGIRWDDPQLGLQWPQANAPILSAKDSQAPLLADVMGRLPRFGS